MPPKVTKRISLVSVVREGLSPFASHVEDWKDCQRCTLCETRRKVVIGRGKIPCDVLFIGEAPGESEDVLGRPFVGPAGKLLDRIVARSIGGKTWPNGEEVTYSMTNLVGCIPRDEAGGKAGEPSEESIEACKPRLESFISLCSPRLIVAVGRMAEDFLTQGFAYSVKLPIPRRLKHTPTLPPSKPKVIAITHPAAILRANVAQQGLEVQRCYIKVGNAVDDMIE